MEFRICTMHKNKNNNRHLLHKPYADCEMDEFARDIWMPQIKKKNRSWQVAERIYNQHIYPELGKIKLRTLNKKNTDLWFENMKSKNFAPATCNRILYVLKSLLGIAYKSKHISDNGELWLSSHFAPQMRGEKIRLSTEKINTLWSKLRLCDEPAARAIELLFLTGASKTEILSAAWENFDRQTASLMVQDENGCARKLSLGPQAINVIENIPRASGSSWIFPGRNPKKHLTNIFRFWKAFRKKCGLESLRIMDFRHNYLKWQQDDNGYLPNLENQLASIPVCASNLEEKKIAQHTPALIIAGFCIYPFISEKERIYANINDDGFDSKFAIARILEKMTENTLNSASESAINLENKKCGVFLGLESSVQQGIIIELLISKLYESCHTNNGYNAASLIKEKYQLVGPAAEYEYGKNSFKMAIKDACEYIVQNKLQMALVLGLEAQGQLSDIGNHTKIAPDRSDNIMHHLRGVMLFIKSFSKKIVNHDLNTSGKNFVNNQNMDSNKRYGMDKPEIYFMKSDNNYIHLKNYQDVTITNLINIINNERILFHG